MISSSARFISLHFFLMFVFDDMCSWIMKPLLFWIWALASDVAGGQHRSFGRIVWEQEGVYDMTVMTTAKIDGVLFYSSLYSRVQDGISKIWAGRNRVFFDGMTSWLGRYGSHYSNDHDGS